MLIRLEAYDFFLPLQRTGMFAIIIKHSVEGLRKIETVLFDIQCTSEINGWRILN